MYIEVALFDTQFKQMEKLLHISLNVICSDLNSFSMYWVPGDPQLVIWVSPRGIEWVPNKMSVFWQIEC